MTKKRVIAIRVALLVALTSGLTLLSTRIEADTASCGGAMITLPFTDVPAGNVFFCSIAEAYFSGLTNGTSPTTYGPASNVTREQMAAFVTRTLDQSLIRGNRRAALRQWWTPNGINDLDLTDVGDFPTAVESDGADLWVANSGSGTVSRVRASDGELIETWTGATGAISVVVAKGKVFVLGGTVGNGILYRINPSQHTLAVTTLTSALVEEANAIAFDGRRIWVANLNNDTPVSIVQLNPVVVTHLTSGFSQPFGILYDGDNIWVSDFGLDSLIKLSSNGTPLASLVLGGDPQHPVFDGINIWVPCEENSTVSVVRVKDANGNPLANPFVLTTLTGNGLDHPSNAAFDGQRIMVTNPDAHTVSLWKASDLTPLGSVPTGATAGPTGACSDGINFWITLGETDKLARF